MRYSKVKEIVQLLFLFFKRNVLQVGLLKSRVFRLFMGMVVIGIISFLSFALFSFFKSVNSNASQTRVVLDAYSCSVFMWTFLVFLFVKILFMKKGSLMEYTTQMPVTNKEKNFAVLTFEIIIALALVLILSSSMIIALICRNGVFFLTRMCCNILFTCVTEYFVFELMYLILGWICSWFGLGKVKNVINICILSVLLICFYVVVIPDVFLSILYTYKEQTGTASILFFTRIAEQYQFGAALLVFVLIVAILGGLILVIPNHELEGNDNYVKLFGRKTKHNTIGRAYFFAFFRKTDTINYYVISLFLFGMMQMAKIENGCYAILILALNALYAYVQTDELRYLTMQKKYSVGRDYVLLIGTQVFEILILSMPMIIITVVTTGKITFLLLFVVSVIFSVIFFTMAGILFPAKNENPFSAITGILFLVLILMAVAAICFFLKLTTNQMMILLILLGILSGTISLRGLTVLSQKRR